MLLESLKGLGETFVEIIHTRMEILFLDVKEARINFISLLILWSFTFLLLALGIIIGVFWLIVIFWDINRFMVMGIITAAFLSCGIILLTLLIRKLKKGPVLFEGIISELARDRDALRGNAEKENL